MEQIGKKIVYVLTSNSRDIYADMNLVSLWSLQYSNPDCNVVIAMDSMTMKCLSESNHLILKENCEFVVVDVDNEINVFRNRYIKTQIRNYISGNFLYLDADTLIRDDLKPIFQTQTPIAGVPNHNGTGSPSEIPYNELKIINEMNWGNHVSFYLNGGVLFFADQQGVYKFCDIWHQRWLESSHKTSKYNDQPALNQALHKSGINYSLLPHRFNSQVHARPCKAFNAAIWHFYLSEPHNSPKNILSHCINILSSNKSNVKYTLEIMLSNNHPWICRNYLDKKAVENMTSSTSILDGDRWERLWLTRSYMNILIKQLVKIKKFINQ